MLARLEDAFSDMLRLHGPLLDLDSVSGSTLRDPTLFNEWLASGPRSDLTSVATRRRERYIDLLHGAFERAFASEDPDAREEQRSLTAIAEGVARLPIMTDSMVRPRGGRAFAARLDSPLNPLGAGISMSLEDVADEALERVAFVPIGPFTEYYVPERTDEGIVLRDPFTSRRVMGAGRSAIRAFLRSSDPEETDALAHAASSRTVPGYLADASLTLEWLEQGEDRRDAKRERRYEAYLGEALIARRLSHVLESAWDALEGDLFGYDGFPLFARSTDANRRIIARALADVENVKGVALRMASSTRTLFAGIDLPENGMLEPEVLGRLTSLVRDVSTEEPPVRSYASFEAETERVIKARMRVEPWSKIIERSFETPVPAFDLGGAFLGPSTSYVDADRMRPLAYLAGNERVFKMLSEHRSVSHDSEDRVRVSSASLGRCDLRHYVDSRSDFAELVTASKGLIGDLEERVDAWLDGAGDDVRDLSVRIHAALSQPPSDPDVSLRFSPGLYAEIPLVARRGTSVLAYRPDFVGLIDRDGSFDVYLADFKLSAFSAKPRRAHRAQLLAYGSLLGTDLREAEVPIGSVIAQVYSRPEPHLSDRIEPGSLLVFDPSDEEPASLVEYLARLPKRVEQLDDPNEHAVFERRRVRDAMQRTKTTMCGYCRERFSEHYAACTALVNAS